jgi:hypothetical protein
MKTLPIIKVVRRKHAQTTRKKQRWLERLQLDDRSRVRWRWIRGIRDCTVIDKLVKSDLDRSQYSTSGNPQVGRGGNNCITLR